MRGCRVFLPFKWQTLRVSQCGESQAISVESLSTFKGVVPEELCDLHGMADSICTSNFFRAFFMVSSRTPFHPGLTC